MGDKAANLSHGKIDPEMVKEFWICKVGVRNGVKWKQNSERMRAGYITQWRGRAINSSLEDGWIIIFDFNRGCLSSQAILNSLLCVSLFSRYSLLWAIMAQQWRVRRCQGVRGRTKGGNIPQASSSASIPLTDDNPSPLSFNWGAQYMAETPPMVEAQIVVKESELLREYENHQG